MFSYQSSTQEATSKPLEMGLKAKLEGSCLFVCVF